MENPLIGKCSNCSKLIYTNDLNNDEKLFIQFSKDGLCSKCRNKYDKYSYLEEDDDDEIENGYLYYE